MHALCRKSIAPEPLSPIEVAHAARVSPSTNGKSLRLSLRSTFRRRYTIPQKIPSKSDTRTIPNLNCQDVFRLTKDKGSKRTPHTELTTFLLRVDLQVALSPTALTSCSAEVLGGRELSSRFPGNNAFP
eukprot:6179318-Amphidinium_carterae.1